MSDLIRREDANEALRECVRAYPNSFYNGIEVARTAIRKLPAVDAVEVKHGRWEEREVFAAKGNVDMLQSAFCTVCQKYHTTPYSYYFTIYNFCPWCGAKMDGGNNEAN